MSTTNQSFVLIVCVSVTTPDGQSRLDNSMLTLCRQVLGAVSSSAGVESIFFYIWSSTLQTEEQTWNRQDRKTCVHIQTVKPTIYFSGLA